MRCHGTTNGRPCRAQPTHQSDHQWCKVHDPKRAKQNRADAKRGGQNRGRIMPCVAPIREVLDLSAVDLKTIPGVTALVAAALSQAADLPFSVGIMHGLASLARVQESLIHGDFEQRLEALERSALGSRALNAR